MSRPDRDDPTRLRDALAAVGGELGLPEHAAVAAIEARWPELVGDAIASRTRVASLRDGVLTVHVDDGAWASEVGFRAEEIAARAAGMVGADAVLRVRVVVRPRAR